VDDAVAVPLKIVAVRVRWLRMTPAPRSLHLHRIVGEHDLIVVGGRR
jgi:hypothetical protein